MTSNDRSRARTISAWNPDRRTILPALVALWACAGLSHTFDPKGNR